MEEAIHRRILLGMPTQWPIFIIDWTDYGRDFECENNIQEKVGLDFAKYTQRSTVYGRRWNKTTEWVDLGTFHEDNGVYFYHTPLPVRTDTVETIQKVLRQRHSGTTLSDPIESSLERRIGVSHFWPIDLVGVYNTNDAKLRRKVSEIVANIGETANLNV